MTLAVHNSTNGTLVKPCLPSQVRLRELSGTPPCSDVFRAGAGASAGYSLDANRLFHWNVGGRARTRGTRSASPIIATHDLGNGSQTDVVLCRQIRLPRAAGIFFANAHNRSFGEFCAALSLAKGHSIALDGVSGIVLEGAKFQMIRTHARRTIALVANHKPLRDRTVVQRVRKHVSGDDWCLARGKSHRRVIPRILTIPEPAALRFNNVGPEPLNSGSRFRQVCAALRAELSSPVLLPRRYGSEFQTTTLAFHNGRRAVQAKFRAPAAPAILKARRSNANLTPAGFALGYHLRSL